MDNLSNALWIELRKAARSRMPFFTAVGFLLLPLIDAFFMIILKDPELARNAGLISTKAQMIAGTADWATFLSILAQGIAVGGIFLFSLIGAWVFGREFADGTLKDLLALPTSRWTILLAKFIVTVIWFVGLTALVTVVALILGALVGLPSATSELILQGVGHVAFTTILVVAVMTPVAFFASIGRGYLLPLGVAILFVLFANVLAVAGWGGYFPWAVPALYAGAAGDPDAILEPASYWIVFLTGLAGIVGTHLWWNFADQSH